MYGIAAPMLQRNAMLPKGRCLIRPALFVVAKCDAAFCQKSLTASSKRC